MANVNFNRGYIDNLPKEINPGTVSIAEDSQELYIDTIHNNINKRIKITDVIDITNDNNIKKLYANKIYINGNKLQKFDGEKLIDVSQVGNSVINLDNVEIKRDATNFNKGILNDEIGKIGDFIIDAKDNIGIIIGFENNETIIQIVSMNNFENQKAEQLIFVGNKTGSKELGTIDDPYTSSKSLETKLIENLKNAENKITINCICDFIFKNIIKWNNVTINGNNFNISFINFENCENVQLINCNLYSTDIDHNLTIKSSSYININNCQAEGGITIDNSLNIYVNNYEGNLNITNCRFVYLNNIKPNKIKSESIISVMSHAFDLTLNNCINCILTVTNSKYIIDELHPNENVITNIKIKDSTFYQMSIDENVNNVELISGKCYGETNESLIFAKSINLGNFEVLNNFKFNNTSKITDAVGISSKQVYDKGDKQYIDNYISHNNLLESDKKSNLEFHLNAIDDSIKNINKSIDSINNNENSLSYLSSAFISKYTFKTIDDLNKQEWKVGNVVKYCGTTTITINNTINDYKVLSLTQEPIQITQDDGSINSDTLVKINLEIGNASYLYKIGDIIKIVFFKEKEFDVVDCDFVISNIILDTNTVLPDKDAHDVITCQVLRSKLYVPSKYELTTDLIYDIGHDKSITIRPGYRLIRISNGWDLLTPPNDNTSDYKIVENYASLSLIDTDDTRKIGTLVYVENENTLYTWKVINTISNTKAWVKFDIESKSDEILNNEYDIIIKSQDDWNKMTAKENWGGVKKVGIACMINSSYSDLPQITVPSNVEYISGVYNTTHLVKAEPEDYIEYYNVGIKFLQLTGHTKCVLNKLHLDVIIPKNSDRVYDAIYNFQTIKNCSCEVIINENIINLSDSNNKKTSIFRLNRSIYNLSINVKNDKNVVNLSSYNYINLFYQTTYINDAKIYLNEECYNRTNSNIFATSGELLNLQVYLNGDKLDNVMTNKFNEIARNCYNISNSIFVIGGTATHTGLSGQVIFSNCDIISNIVFIKFKQSLEPDNTKTILNINNNEDQVISNIINKYPSYLEINSDNLQSKINNANYLNNLTSNDFIQTLILDSCNLSNYIFPLHDVLIKTKSITGTTSVGTLPDFDSTINEYWILSIHIGTTGTGSYGTKHELIQYISGYDSSLSTNSNFTSGKIFVRRIEESINETTNYIELTDFSPWSCINDKETASTILTKIKTVDGSGSGLDADLIDGKQGTQLVNYGYTSGTLLGTSLPSSTSNGQASMYRFYDSSNLLGEGSNVYYGIMQIYYSSSYYIRIAISMSSGRVYRQTSGQTTWSELNPKIPVLTSDPTNPVSGDMWIISN